MTVVPGLGEPAARRDIAAARDAIHVVAEELCLLGAGRQSTIHGSAATGELAFIRDGESTWLASDIDVMLFGHLSENDSASLEQQLSQLFRTALATYATPASKVSVKVYCGQGTYPSEFPSLLRSATARGVTAEDLWLCGAHCAIPTLGTVLFPLALEYGLWRWLQCLGGGMAANAVAMHEVVKAIWRSGPEGRSSGIVASRAYGPHDALGFAIRHQFVLARYLGSSCTRIVRLWAAAEDPLSWEPPVDMRLAAIRRLRASVLRALPNSILSMRIAASMPEHVHVGT